MIDWNLARGPNSFENALSQGLQFGSHLAQQRRQEEQQNALSAYAIDPNNEKNFNALATHLPQVALEERGRRDAAARQAAQSGAEGVSQFRPVLEQVQANPALWGQARQSAIQSGIDASRIPEQYDPNWVQGQLLFLNAAEDGSLPGIARELQVAGIDVETPEGQQVLRQVIEGRYASEYTDEQGNVRRQRLFDLPQVGGQQQAPAPQTGAQQTQIRVTPREYGALVQRYGPEAVSQRIAAGQAIVTVTTPDEARTLPSGTRILLPDGTEGMVP